MKRTLVLFLITLALTGCAPPEQFIDFLFGIKRNVAVLSSTESDISEAVSFAPKEAEVVGSSFQVCVVLKRDGLGKSPIWAETSKLLDESKLSATVQLADGTIHDFTCPSIGWSREGRVFPTSSEVINCVRPGCGKREIPVGSKVKNISISSKSPVHVLGAYWESTSGFDHGN